MKKILLGFGSLAFVLVVMPMFAAFEAHVVNVTAQIENALSVPIDLIDFGTVFPQELLEKPLGIALSRSFSSEDRVDDIEYFIRQKPKCALTNEAGTEIIGPTWTGHIVPTDQRVKGYFIDCESDRPADVQPRDNPEFYLLPSLCEYISKHPDNQPENDGSLDSFHQPWTVEGPDIIWNDTHGRLAKSEQDLEDNWTIDLAVPCFGSQCAQDWEEFVRGVNPEANADDFVQPTENEHKVFGCNLWVEVSEVSEVPERCEYSVVPTGEPYEGEFGSTVTPVEITNTDCSVDTDVLKLEHTMNYQQGQPEGQPAGWAGWSCVESGYPEVVGGGVIPENADVFAQGEAEFGAAAVDGNNYPNYPHYTFNGGVNADGGEEGWVVEAAGTNPPTSIYALCAS